MVKKLLSTLLSVSLLLSLCVVPAFAAESFGDVNTEDYYADAIDWAYEQGLMSGVGGGNFAPRKSTNRAMLLTVLWRLESKPAATGANPFTDVASDEWYTEAVIWGSENKLIQGYGNGLFGPADTLTREQLVTILYRYAQFKGYNMETEGDLSNYTDAAGVADWAKPAMLWAVERKLINGVTDTTLAPQGDAIRGQLAVILNRLVVNVIEPGTETPPHTHSYTYTPNFNSTHQKACSCGITATEDCTYDGDQCPLCQYQRGSTPATRPASLTVEPIDYDHPEGLRGIITVNDVAALLYLTKLNTVDWYDLDDGENAFRYRSDWAVKLNADIDLNNLPIDPIGIGGWREFDGNGHTISNAVTIGGCGLFRGGYNVDIRNLTVNTLTVDSPYIGEYVGGIINIAGTLSNVHVVDATVFGGKYTGGLAGKTTGDVLNCSIRNSTVAGSNMTVGGMVGYSVWDAAPDSITHEITISGNLVEDVTVTGLYNVGGMFGQLQTVETLLPTYKLTAANNTVENSTVISTSVLPGSASDEECRAEEIAAHVLNADVDSTNIAINVTCIEQ